jgi:hypothetical protein
LAAALLLAFLFGMLRQVSWALEVAVMFFYGISAVALVPAWFVLLGLGLGKVDSIESLNMGLLGGVKAPDGTSVNPVGAPEAGDGTR